MLEWSVPNRLLHYVFLGEEGVWTPSGTRNKNYLRLDELNIKNQRLSISGEKIGTTRLPCSSKHLELSHYKSQTLINDDPIPFSAYVIYCLYYLCYFYKSGFYIGKSNSRAKIFLKTSIEVSWKCNSWAVRAVVQFPWIFLFWFMVRFR